MTLSVSTSRLRSLIASVAIAGLSWAVISPAFASGGSSGASLSQAASAVVDPTLHGITGTAHVIVQGARATESEVVKLGGKITRQLPIINGYAAAVPASKVATLAHTAGVRAITRDSRMKVMATTPMAGPGGLNPANVYQSVTGASALKAAGDKGQGVTVAIIDTGVDSMADTASRLVQVQTTPIAPPLGPTASCMNFSSDPDCTDNYGHGTFLAGLVAGTGAASGGQYAGVAPNAKILAIKATGIDGSADVSTIIATLQYVIAFKDTYNIKVVNLSLGTDGSQTYQLSPLDYAVEKVWKAGIVAVVSASNLGPGAGTVDKPADDPFVITVGATDDNGTKRLSDDTVPPWSAQGPTKADGLTKPDVTVPGTGLISLAAPGAAITTEYPPAMAPPYRQGSGTSMSTAVVSGLVADILSAHPSWSPDRVKYALMSTAASVAGDDPNTVGAGEVEGYAALNAPAGLANQDITPGTGLGSLQADRGSVSVQVDGVGGATVVQGEVTAQLTPWNFANLLQSTFDGSSWWGSSWWGSSWWGSSWWGSSWWGSSWWGSSWWGSSWWGAQWYGFWQ
jgi:serine protease AprX